MAGDRYDVATLEQALGRLGPALEILDGFTYRNKNQHRLSKWWAQLDMLRRGTRKLSLDLQDSVRGRPSQGKKRKKRAVGEGADQKLDLRARHLRAQIVPRSYLAFTQLASDNQYAQLGLALLGVLAQIDQAASALAERETVAASSSAGAGSAVEAAGCTTGQPEPRASEPVDIGIAVSRADVARGLDAGRPSPGADRDLQEGVPASLKDDALRGEGERRQEMAGRGGVDNQPPKAKKQKRDEFDDLFSSLEPKSSSKKKKRKKKDEFDDLFSSLL